jgi:hypothetical protein
LVYHITRAGYAKINRVRCCLQGLPVHLALAKDRHEQQQALEGRQEAYRVRFQSAFDCLCSGIKKERPTHQNAVKKLSKFHIL